SASSERLTPMYSDSSYWFIFEAARSSLIVSISNCFSPFHEMYCCYIKNKKNILFFLNPLVLKWLKVTNSSINNIRLSPQPSSTKTVKSDHVVIFDHITPPNPLVPKQVKVRVLSLNS